MSDVDVSALWSTVVDRLADDDRVTPQLMGFVSLIRPRTASAGVLHVEVPNDLTRSTIEQWVRAPLDEALSAASDGELRQIRSVVNADLDLDAVPARQEPAVKTPAPLEPSRPATTRLNPKYTFDTFVIGGSNRFAHAAAVAVAESPAKAYNPLFIYGDSGLGKTHLLHAIGHYAHVLDSKKQIRYVNSEDFTNDFINSIQTNTSQEFNRRYREVDILLIDDIQFLQGKEQTQEAFFHTFNTLHDHAKQVVITSDVHPKNLTGFEARMRSRFEWGLLTDVQAPDLETRIAILRKKAQNDRIQVSGDVLEYIASKVSSNIRELEGILIRVTAFANLNRAPLDLDLVKTVLKDVGAGDDENVITEMDIVNQTAAYFKLSVEDLFGSSRAHAIAFARQVAMYLCREMTTMSLPEIGRLFGDRHHTTVLYANKTITQYMKERRSVYNQVTELTSRIRQQHRR